MIINDFIKNQIEKTTLDAVRRLGGGTEAQKKKVRSSFIPDQLNKVLEALHTEIYKYGFKLKLLHGNFAAKSRKPIRDARKFKKTFQKCTALEDEKDYYWGEFQMDLTAWMNIFNGSNKEDVNAGETNSYMSAGSVASSLKKNSVRGESPQRSVKIRGDDEFSQDMKRDRNTFELAVEKDKDVDSSKNDYDSESDD